MTNNAYGNPTLVSRFGGLVDTQKRIRTNEKSAYGAITRYITAIKNYREKGDWRRFETDLKLAERDCNLPEVSKFAGNVAYKADKLLERCEDLSDRTEQIDNFEQEVLKIREPLEVKAVRNLLREIDTKEDGMRELKKHFDDMSEGELHSSIRGLLEDYKQHRTPENRALYNKVLALQGMQIVEIPPKELALNDKLVARFAFEGAFILPDRKDEYGYSRAFRNFLNDPTPRCRSQIDEKDFASLPFVQSMNKNENMSLMKSALKKVLQDKGIDFETAKKFNLNDCGYLLFEAYGPRDRMPQKDDLLVFSKVNSCCEPGIRQNFWKAFARKDDLVDFMKQDMLKHGVDPRYVKDLIENMKENGTVTLPDQQDKYKRPLPRITVHHKLHIKDAGHLDNVMDVDRMGNFMACVDYGIKDHQDEVKRGSHLLRHAVDGTNAAGNFERLVDVKDSAINMLVLSCGLRKNFYIDKNPDNDRKQMPTRVTYLDIAKKQSEVRE